MRILFLIIVAVVLLAPLFARADAKGPLDYSLKQYGFTLAVALLGGLVSWLAKVRRGDAQLWNVMQLVGELCTSAFAGLLAFWLCEWSSAPPLMTAALTGIAGHMGTRAISVFEEFAQKRFGVPTDKGAPHA